MKSNLIVFLTFMVLFSGTSTMAAIKLDFNTVDLLTYRYYQEKKWDSVIVIGKQALRQDIDYYYLRVRMGIAYFEKSEYFPATTHLKKARQFNSEDPLIANYLYYAYLYSNRVEEAGLIKPYMNVEAQQKSIDNSGSQNGVFQEVHAEGGYTISSDRTPDNLATLIGNDSIYGEQDLYGNSLYSNLSIKLRISKRVRLSMAYNYLSFAKTKYIQYGHAEAQRDTIIDNPFSRDYFYSFPWKIHDTSFKYNVFQHEGYISASVIVQGGIKIIPAVHLVHVGYAATSPGIHNDSVSDTAYYSKFDSTYHLFRYPSMTYTYNKQDTSFNNWVVSLGLSKDFGKFSIGLNSSWSNLNNKKQKQAGISITYYPYGNLNFYGTTAMTGFFEGNDKRLLLSQVLGVKITPWMWGEANFYYGDYTNANIFNGSIVYNNSDIIKYRGGATLFFVVGKHMQLSLIYQYFRKESQQIYYIKTQDPVSKEINEIQQIKNNPYNTNTLIGGITWKL
jgi:hypothetical protein